MNDATSTTIQDGMMEILNRQKRAYIAEGEVSVATRIDRLDRSVALLKKYGPRFCEAMAGDFGHRSIEQSKMTDIDGAIGPLQQARKHVKGWMKSEKRNTMFPLGLFGSRSRIDYQPLGVIGCISPWNFP
ncbi:MAG: aldehyde dehydrogenase family protein, partial [SAR86 cluster bacterium]|nr:aldehyde dehydrogenase family protein [SAR86 cluster bacterium]